MGKGTPPDISDVALGGVGNMIDFRVETPTPKLALSTGLTLLDCLLDSDGGGVPSGRPIHIYGPPKSGKSLLGYLIGAAVQREGGLVVIVDTEYFAPRLADLVGMDYLDPKKFLHFRPDTLEQAADLLESLYVSLSASPVPVLVFMDSLAGNDALSNQNSVMEGQTYQQAKPAQLWSEFFKRMALKRTYYSSIFPVFSNQVRLKLDFHSRLPPAALPLGGYGVAHSMHIEIGCDTAKMLHPGSGVGKMKAADRIVVGTWLKIKASKNRQGPSHYPIRFPLYYSWGVDDILSNMHFLKETSEDPKVFGRVGAFYVYQGAKRHFKAWHKLALENADLAALIRTDAKTLLKQHLYGWTEDKR